MPYEIFISYSRDDATLCDTVKALLVRIGYKVFVDRAELAAGPEWRAQLEEVLSQKDIRPYLVLLATRAAVKRPERIQDELRIAEEKNLDIIAIEFDVGAVKALRGTRKHQYIECHSRAVDDRLEDELRKAFNIRVKKELERRRTDATDWIGRNNLLPEPSFWGGTWREYFPAGDDPSGRPASVALTARGGSGKSVLIAHCLKALLEDPTTYPLVLTEELLKDALRTIPRLLEARTAQVLPAHLEALAKEHSQCVVFIVDGLDQMVIPGDPGQTRLIEAINLLANSARLIIGCRKEYWDTVYAGRVSVRKMEVDELDVRQVAHLLAKHSHLKFDTGNALLRIPFFLGLTLSKATVRERVPKTEIGFLQQVWSDALAEASTGGHGEILPEDTGHSILLDTLAKLQLKDLTFEVPKDELRVATGLGDVFERGLCGLKAKGLVVERPAASHGSSLRLCHDLLDSFAMVRILLGAPDRLNQCRQLCCRADKDCGWTVLAMLVRALHYYGQEQPLHGGGYQQLLHELFEEFLFILDHKRFGDDEMARAWAVTHVLKDCFPLLFPFIGEALAGRRVASLNKDNAADAAARASRLGPDACLTQEAASTLASAFMVLREGTAQDARSAVPILAQALNVWDLKGRFLDALAKYRTEATCSAIVDYGTRQLAGKSDVESLHYVAQALKYFDEPPALQLLQKIYQDPQLEGSMIRRVAAESLNHLRPGSVAVPERSEEEIVQGLKVKERDRYSDWNVVKDYADYVRIQIPAGRVFSPRVLDALVGALDHDQIYVRRPVAMALAYFNEPAARDALLDELLEDVVPLEVREACLDGLRLQFRRCDAPRVRQNFRGLLLRAARIASRNGAAATARELTDLALAGAGRTDDWLADPVALEVVAPADGGQVVCEILDAAAAPPVESSVLDELRRFGPQNTGPDLEPKYRVTHLARREHHALHVRLAPTTWTLGKGFHDAALADPGRFRRAADGSWIEPLPLGTAVLPGLAAVHAIVLTGDGKVLVAQRSAKVGYAPLHWSVSYEEQVTPQDFAPGSDMFATTARRGFLEEFGIVVPPERSQTLSALLQLDLLNPGVVVLLQPEATADEIRDRWRAEPRPVHHWEVEDVAFLDSRVDVLQRIASGEGSLDEVMQSSSGKNSSDGLHPTSRIRCAMLVRWLHERSADR